MAEGTLSQAEIDKLMSQEPQGAKAPAPVAANPPVSRRESKPEPKAQDPAPSKPSAPEPVVPVAQPAPNPIPPAASGDQPAPIVMRTDASPEPLLAPSLDVEGIISPLQAAIDALSRRVDSAEKGLGRISVLEKSVSSTAQSSSQNSNHVMERVLYLEQEITGIRNIIQTLSQDLQRAFAGFDGLTRQVKEINRGLEGTMGYDIRRNFTCEKCGSQGYVAGLVKCSCCEEEDWWGWWPPED